MMFLVADASNAGNGIAGGATIGLIISVVGIVCASVGTFYSARQSWKGAKVQTLLKVTEWMELTRADRRRVRELSAKALEDIRKNSTEDAECFARVCHNFKWLRSTAPENKRLQALAKAELDQIPREEQEHFDRVCRSFDLLGFMDRHHLIDETLVNELYATALASLHSPVFDVFVMARRAGNPTHFWELVELDARVSGLGRLHPARRNGKAWPRSPRRRL